MKIKTGSFIFAILFCSLYAKEAITLPNDHKAKVQPGHSYEAHKINTKNTRLENKHSKDKNIKELAALSPKEQDDFGQNDFDSTIFNMHILTRKDRPLTGDHYEDGVIMARILQACTAKCGLSDLTCTPLKSCHSDNRQDPCTGVIIPADRQAFLDCFRQGANEFSSHFWPLVYVAQKYYCDSSTCSDDGTRYGCMLLLCNNPSSLSSCLQDHGQSCYGY